MRNLFWRIANLVFVSLEVADEKKLVIPQVLHLVYYCKSSVGFIVVSLTL